MSSFSDSASVRFGQTVSHSLPQRPTATGHRMSMTSGFGSEFDFDMTAGLQKPFFAAIYEYAQGSPPQTIWEYELNSLDNPDDFMIYVVNTPVAGNSGSVFMDTDVCVQSHFKGVHYLALYSEILDVEARGFIRTIVFVIGNTSSFLVDAVRYHYIEDMRDIMQSLIRPAKERFLGELMIYAASLEKVTQENSSNAALSSKLEQLKHILPHFGINEVDITKAQDYNVEYFSRIQNDLRRIPELAGVTSLCSTLEEFVESLPLTLVTASVASKSDYIENYPGIDFGGFFGHYSMFAVQALAHTCNTDKFKLCDLVAKNAFQYCAYSILSGHTLVIQSKDIGEATALARKFAIIVPFFQEEYIKVMDECTPRDCLRYAIVVTSNLRETKSNPNMVSWINFDNTTYQGDGCPVRSFVMTELGSGSKHNESAFLLNVYSCVKRVSNKFIAKLAELQAKMTPKLLARVQDQLRDVGFGEDDVPIVRYWLHCYFNQQRCKPIMLNDSHRRLAMLPHF